MKNRFLTLTVFIVTLVSCSSEDDVSSDSGTLSIDYGLNTNVILKAATEDDAAEDFALTILNDQDEEVASYEKIADAPSEIELETGTYTVQAFSKEFTEPAFETPVYGGETEASVVSDKNTQVNLTCTQTNAGLTFDWSNIDSLYSSYSAIVSYGSNSLEYSSSESRIGYFPTGDVDILITLGEGEEVATYTKSITLNEREIVTVIPAIVEPDSGSIVISITIDDGVDERDVALELGDDDDNDSGISDEIIENAVLYEDFSTAENGNTNGDSSNSSWSGNDNWTTVERAYQTSGSIRLGSTSSVGSITSKGLDLSGNSGVFTVSFDVKGWYETDTLVVVSAGSESDTVSFSSSGKEYDMVTVSANFIAGTESTAVKIGTLMDGSSTIRVFIDNVVVSH